MRWLVLTLSCPLGSQPMVGSAPSSPVYEPFGGQLADFALARLKDSYCHITVHPNYRKYLRIVVGGKVFQFKALPFRLPPATREFCQVSPGTLLHKLTMYLHLYLDYWLLRDMSRAICLAHTQITLEKGQAVGFHSELGQVKTHPNSKVCLPLRGL